MKNQSKKQEEHLAEMIQENVATGIRYLQQDQLEAALDHFKEALKNPEIPREIPLTYLGVLRFKQGQIEEAERYFLQALEHNPDSEQANFNLAVLCQHNRDYRRALPYYKQALLQIGDDAEIYERMADCCYSLNDKTDAEPFYDAALKMRPDSVNAAVKLAEIYLEKGDSQKALEVLQVGIVSHPELPEFYLAAGNIYQQMGERERALAHFRKVVILDKNNFDGFFQLAEICFDLGLLKQAFPFYAKSYRLNPLPYLLYRMGRIYEKQRRRLPASQMYEKWIEREKQVISEKDEPDKKEYERVNRFVANYYNSSGDTNKEKAFHANIALLRGAEGDQVLTPFELQSLQLN